LGTGFNLDSRHTDVFIIIGIFVLRHCLSRLLLFERLKVCVDGALCALVILKQQADATHNLGKRPCNGRFLNKPFKSTALQTQGMPRSSPYWLIRDGQKLIQCSKEAFDKAIVEGKSVKYGFYANKKNERVAEELEASRMELLGRPGLPPKFRAVLTDPKNVVDVQIVTLMDAAFWIRESKQPKYRQ
jgi:hypothetical protein